MAKKQSRPRVRKPRGKVGWYEQPGRTRNGLPVETLTALNRDIDRLVKRYFEPDEEGDFPVAVNVRDRTRYVPSNYWPLTHAHKATPAELLANLKAAALNCSMAADDLRRTVLNAEIRLVPAACEAEQAKRLVDLERVVTDLKASNTGQYKQLRTIQQEADAAAVRALVQRFKARK